jgi:hypothetical protein
MLMFRSTSVNSPIMVCLFILLTTLGVASEQEREKPDEGWAEAFKRLRLTGEAKRKLAPLRN